MTCRDEILSAVQRIVDSKGKNEFEIQEVLHDMKVRGTEYSESTIRTHITSRLCMNAPKNHGVKYSDFERIGKGVYKLL